MDARRIGFIGAGNMATAIAQGLISQLGVAKDSIRASDPSVDTRDRIEQTLGIRAQEDNGDLVQWADVVVLAVKPQVLKPVLSGIEGFFRADQLVLSVCAGVTLETLSSALPRVTRFGRVMPNTPALVGQGASAVAFGEKVASEDRLFVKQLLEGVGECVEVAESYMDAVTGLSGSGPAYIMLVIEALADGGVKAGLPRDVSLRLATQTVLGTAHLVKETGEHPAVLKDRVTSPGGTTITGVLALERGGLRATLMNAVLAATQRSKEMA